LQEAAKQALTEGARELALRYLRLAHRADVGNAQRATTTAMLARAEWRGNPSTALRHATELIEAAREGLLTGRDAVASIHHLLWFGQVDLAVRALRDVERTVSQTDPVTAAHVQNTWLWLAHTYPAYRGHLRMDVVPATVSSHLQAATTLRSVLMRGCDSDLVADAEQILKECLLDEWMLAPAGAAVFALIYGDQLSTATMWCELLAGQAQAHNAPTWHAFFSALRAEIALRQGDLPMAEAYARTALTIVSPKGWGVAIGLPLSTLLQASTAMGNYEDAVNHLRVPVPDAIFQTVTGLHYLRARGLYHQAVGRLHAAAADFQAVGDLMVAWGMDFPALIPWRTDVAQVFLETSRVRQARELAAEQLRRVDPTQLRARGISMRVLAIGANPSQRLALLGQAVEALQETEDRRELARALTELDKAHQARGKTDQARPIVGRAKQGNQSGVGDARRAAPLELMTRRPKGHLTGAEQRVATLAGQGLTNRQIADRLYITVSTVEQHLTSAYRKLKLSRADLRRRLRSDQPMKPDRGSAAEGPPRDHTAM
jgi:DNA-binding CsgD family transcriptional regulator